MDGQELRRRRLALMGRGRGRWRLRNLDFGGPSDLAPDYKSKWPKHGLIVFRSEADLEKFERRSPRRD